jgi:hypothetical protein
MSMSKAVLSFLKENLFVLAVLAAIVVAFVVLRTPPSDVQSPEELQVLLAGGRPVLVELYSNT